jgi:hypothetical protein
MPGLGLDLIYIYVLHTAVVSLLLVEIGHATGCTPLPIPLSLKNDIYRRNLLP